MEYLNKELLHQMSREQLEEYRARLQERMAQVSMFLLQVTEVIEEKGN